MIRLWVAPLGLHVEPAQAGDAEAMARLHAAGFYRGWPQEDFSAYLAEAGISAFVACDARRRIAGFALFRIAADEAELVTIAVEPRWRRKGVGEALLRAAFTDLAVSPVRRVFLEVAIDNPAALKLYRRRGFIEVGRRDAYYARANGTPATALVMARDVG